MTFVSQLRDSLIILADFNAVFADGYAEQLQFPVQGGPLHPDKSSSL